MKKKQGGQSSQQGSVDSILNLPEDVMRYILALMPIRDAVRTSILSKEWRYKWVTITDVVFNGKCLMAQSPSSSAASNDVVFNKDILIAQRASSSTYEAETACAHVVDQLVSQLIGPIFKFSCMFFSILSSHHIDRWIMFLSRNHGNEIKEFRLAIDIKVSLNNRGKMHWYNVPCSIFYYKELRRLELLNCILDLPPKFKGFHNLSVLYLAACISADDIERLISECPLLEWLKFIAFEFYQCLNIHAPNLRYLELDGEFRDISIKSSPVLTNVSLNSDIPPSMWNAHGSPCTSIQFIGYLHGVERLALAETFLQYLCIDIVPKKLSATLDHLKYLEVDIELNSTEILAILCILRSSPNLEQLKIKYCVDDEGTGEGLLEEEDDLSGEQVELYGVKTQFDSFLCHLHAVEVEITGLAMLLDLQFIRWILSNAPALKTIKIYTNVYVEAETVSRILKELLQSRRASPQAEIIYLGVLGHHEVSY
ncbi:F-box/FBD/LRR-repeat-like protein isoform X1 [Cinnamomum micranthum f. kanehirae]|uniref:F-box/FBD/LRR-repeat-like protein isoform X1 n=1 Tax=Cinnamomum micranthum f. kanehirae TaxID=337451 RepID=A0A3S3R4X3_9MAGN|nr:F-box/FBD/LRR-repeat-like protein isoform X1 [Cinnamomum micranthum f. kanehirae]